jgi:hypothetical protein
MPSFRQTLPVQLIRMLDLHSEHGVPSFVAAASGLVRIGRRLHVIADDALYLASFLDESPEPGVRTRLLPGELPLEAKARKAAKPDFECLVALPAFGSHRSGALLAMGSGSKEQRARAVLLGLSDSGELNGSMHMLDFSPLFDALKARVDLLNGKRPNIEGAVIWRDHFCLLHRGNKSSANVLIRMALPPVLAALAAQQSPMLITDSLISHTLIQSVDLGSIDDVMLGWTDADVLGDQLIVSAAAERTDNAIDDGACRGSAIALINWDGRVVQQHPIEGMHKVEGIAAIARNGIIHLDLVTDNDDPASPAWHLRAQVA